MLAGARIHAPLVAILWLALLGPACNSPAEVVRPEALRSTTPGATALVVVYSRTGHTARAGRAIARVLGADYLRIQGTGREGGSLASTPSAWTPVPVQPASLDVSRYRLVILGTPIWYWKPSALAVSFSERLDLRGKDVVLFHTNQGGVRAAGLAEWRRRIERRGGRVRDLIGLDRKRLGSETVEAAAERITRERQGRWR